MSRPVALGIVITGRDGELPLSDDFEEVDGLMVVIFGPRDEVSLMDSRPSEGPVVGLRRLDSALVLLSGAAFD